MDTLTQMFRHKDSKFESRSHVDDIYRLHVQMKLYNKDYNDWYVTCFLERIHSKHVGNLSLNKPSCSAIGIPPQSKPSQGVFFSNFPRRLTERPSGSLGFNNQKLS